MAKSSARECRLPYRYSAILPYNDIYLMHDKYRYRGKVGRALIIAAPVPTSGIAMNNMAAPAG